jgi:hypothetical protein
MQVHALNCPTCGAPAPDDILLSGQQFRCEACGSILVLLDVNEEDSVLCPDCRQRNPLLNRHCSACGTTLQVDCPFCYKANPVDAVHCAGCGADLRRAFSRKRDWLAEKRRHDEERLQAWKRAEVDSRNAGIQRLLDELDEPENHSLAIYCLRNYGDHAVEPLIETLKTDEDPDARFGAAHALGLIGDPRAVPALVGALADPEPAVRHWAVEALGKMQAHHAVEAIARLLKDPHEGVRDRARETLERMGTPEALQALKGDKKRRLFW